MFSSSGISAVSVDDVCAVAGVSKGTVFYNFRSKDGLYEAVIEHGIEDLAHAIDNGRAGHYGAEALDLVIEEVLLLVSRHQHVCRVAWMALFGHERPGNPRIQAFRAQLLEPIVDVLQEIELEHRSRGGASPTPPRDAFEASAMAFLGGLISSALDHVAYHPGTPLRYVHSALLTSLVVPPD